jgi:hypothetical protein
VAKHSEDPQRGWEKWQHRDDPPPPPPPVRRDPLEYRVPVLLTLIGLTAMFGSDYVLEGKSATLDIEKAHIIGFILLLDVPLTILGLQLLGRFFGISYGATGAAIVKLIGMAVFLEGLVFVGFLLGYPIPFHLLLVPLSWLLFAWLFRLDGKDMICSLIGLWMFHLVLWLVFILTVTTYKLREEEREKKKSEPNRSWPALVSASGR